MYPEPPQSESETQSPYEVQEPAEQVSQVPQSESSVHSGSGSGGGSEAVANIPYMLEGTNAEKLSLFVEVLRVASVIAQAPEEYFQSEKDSSS